jgi:hypothetical protein
MSERYRLNKFFGGDVVSGKMLKGRIFIRQRKKLLI